MLWENPAWGLPRNPAWHVELLDHKDRPLGSISDRVTGGTINLTTDRLGGSGTLLLDDVEVIDFRNHRARMIFDPDVAGVEPWPVATMRFMSPVETRDQFGSRYQVQMLQKLSLFDSASAPAFFTLPAGTNIVDAIVDLIESTGETRIAVTESGAVLSSATIFEGMTLLEVANKLADAAVYWAIKTDGSGQYRVEPYRLPSERPVSWVFRTPGQGSLLIGEWGREHDYVSIPNVARVYREGDDDTPGIEGVYINTDPSDPDSVVNKPEQALPTESVEVETQGDADRLAYRRWADAQSPYVKITATHEVVPIGINEVARFDPDGGRLMTLQSASYDLRFDGTMETTWRNA